MGVNEMVWVGRCVLFQGNTELLCVGLGLGFRRLGFRSLRDKPGRETRGLIQPPQTRSPVGRGSPGTRFQAPAVLEKTVTSCSSPMSLPWP